MIRFFCYYICICTSTYRHLPDHRASLQKSTPVYVPFPGKRYTMHWKWEEPSRKGADTLLFAVQKWNI